jgi:hypothetical protein
MSLLLAILLAAQDVGEPQTYQDPDGGFRFAIPAEFVAEPGDTTVEGAPRCWIRPGGSANWIRLCVMRLSGELPRDQRQTASPAGPATSFRWKGLDISGVRSTSSPADGPETMFQVVLPVRPNAVGLMTISPAGEAESAHAVLVNTIASLEGESSWQPSTERAERTGQAVGQVGMIIMAIGVGMWIMKRRQAKEGSRTGNPRKP